MKRIVGHNGRQVTPSLTHSVALFRGFGSVKYENTGLLVDSEGVRGIVDSGSDEIPVGIVIGLVCILTQLVRCPST